jgi:succinate dehydrogenase/fumarate reductase cytochrome b subunit
MFIWLFHRLSGLTLVVLIGIKILTGFYLLPKDNRPDWALSLHRHPVIDVLIVVLFTFHSIYGIRTIIIDLGFRKEEFLFWSSNIIAAIISAVLIYYFVRFS